jgi:excisionase family DNA binding protein
LKAKLKETAKILGVSEYFLRTEAKAGRIPFYMSGSTYIFDVEQLDQFLKDMAMANMARDEKPKYGTLRKIEA